MPEPERINKDVSKAFKTAQPTGRTRSNAVTSKTALPAGRPRRNAVTSLQQTAGNRAVAQLMARKGALRQPRLGVAPGVRGVGRVAGMGGILASLATLRNMENQMMRGGGLTLNALNARRAMMMEMLDQLEAHVVRSRRGVPGTGRNRYGQMGRNVGGDTGRTFGYGDMGRYGGSGMGRTFGYGEMGLYGGGGMGHGLGAMGGKNLSGGRSTLAKYGVFGSGTGLGVGKGIEGKGIEKADPEKAKRENQKLANDVVAPTIKAALGAPGIEAWKKLNLSRDRKEILARELNTFLVEQVRDGAYKNKVANDRFKEATDDIIEQVLLDWPFVAQLKNVSKASLPEMIQGRVYEAIGKLGSGGTARFK